MGVPPVENAPSMDVVARCTTPAVRAASRAERSAAAPPPGPRLRPARSPVLPVPEMDLDSSEACADAGGRPVDSADRPLSAQASSPLGLGADGGWQSGAGGRGLAARQDGEVCPPEAEFGARSQRTEERCFASGAREDRRGGRGADVQPVVSPWLQLAIDGAVAEIVQKSSALVERV